MRLREAEMTTVTLRVNGVAKQWLRQDEHGWDPKGPPQLLELRAAVDAQGGVSAWRRARGFRSPRPTCPILAAARS
jgi:hypothetical protein